MDKNLIEQYIFNLKRGLLFPKFLKQNGFDRNIIKMFLDSDKFKSDFTNLVEYKTFDIKSIAEVFSNLFEGIGRNVDDELITFTYKYSVNLSFADTEEINANNDMIPYANFLLKIYSYINRIEKIYGDDQSWQKKYPIDFITTEEQEELEDAREYIKFKKYFMSDYVYEMIKLSQDIMGFTTLDHICGVHHLALKIGRQLKSLDYPIDLGKVSGSAAGHDIGKYVCKINERKRVAYYHYHYTGEWFKERKIVYIRNIAINHSTWDLELENLQLEALILIYCDFRVKGDETGAMKFYSLDESFKVILDKLDNVDDAKELRYRNVYKKLKDFEKYLRFIGIKVDPDDDVSMTLDKKKRKKYYSLLHGQDIIEHSKFASIEHNIKLLYRLRDEGSLNKILENARDVENQIGKRGYINVLKEYSAYLTQKQKLIALNFLYDSLITPEDDIRKDCAYLMGSIIANYDEELRKEVPESVNKLDPDMTGLDLFRKYTHIYLRPDQKIIGRHRRWINRSLIHMIRGYILDITSPRVKVDAINIIVDLYKTYQDQDQDSLTKALIKTSRALKFEILSDEQLSTILEYLYIKVDTDSYEIRLLALETAIRFLGMENITLEMNGAWHELLSRKQLVQISKVETYLRLECSYALNKFDKYTEIEKDLITKNDDFSDIYLSNLKTATLEIVKKIQIEILVKSNFKYRKGDAFYTALHLCNLLKVSSMEEVRTRAGEGLVTIISILSFEQRNDIIVELLRALEMESYQVTRYIPDYLGRLLTYIKPEELDELLYDFKYKIKKSNAQTGMLILKTVGQAILNYDSYKETFGESQEKVDDRLEMMLGILLNGFVSYIPSVTQIAFNVIGKYIYGSDSISLEYKAKIFKYIGKKLLALIITTDEMFDLTFFYNSAGLKHIYKFISLYNTRHGKIEMDCSKKIAFFPGSFDPFSLSHKQIAVEIAAMGYEVYLAVDEFSWSKRTHPNIRRRDIIKMSVADELNIFTFPRDLIANIGNPEDLKRLAKVFSEKEVYIVVGSDVILNASAYNNPVEEGSIMTFPHVVFERPMEYRSEILDEKFDVLFSKLPSNSVKFKLSSEYENISSTQIRDYIDENRDISEMVDPLAQRYIYTKGLYQREPQFKELMTTKSVTTEIISNPDALTIEEIAKLIGGDFTSVHKKLKLLIEKKIYRLLVIRSILDNRKVIGASIFHWLKSSDIFSEFEDEAFQNNVRDNSVGRIFVIDGIHVSDSKVFSNPNQVVLTETLAYALSHDYSYAIYKDEINDVVPSNLACILKYQGFLEVDSNEASKKIYTTNMTSPCTLNLDIKSCIKEPFRNSYKVSKVV
ncbi:MAG: cytidyltransferase [Acidaminobacteraceae bacterium]